MFESGQCGYISPGFPALHYKNPHYIIVSVPNHHQQAFKLTLINLTLLTHWSFGK
ncbi:hypothetical protein CROQUDRAFT_178989 [Cronartium quercuum f. sp. fusiforme G11]|uniref:Uncharacterized protein n=1 Tax=Cronartium quercuum f. sp. fusiforme G11 TaxID=708437 RepID=A0A9P6NR00_9BASI|nr:hypothetical protein CROQUDRAFT_178989 [Cronartium quercuum f. sp. fusiforme G11]